MKGQLLYLSVSQLIPRGLVDKLTYHQMVTKQNSLLNPYLHYVDSEYLKNKGRSGLMTIKSDYDRTAFIAVGHQEALKGTTS